MSGEGPDDGQRRHDAVEKSHAVTDVEFMSAVRAARRGGGRSLRPARVQVGEEAGGAAADTSR